MKVTIGNLQSGAMVEFETAAGIDLDASLVTAFDTLRAAQRVGDAHFDANASAEEKKRRDMFVKNQQLETQRIEKSNEVLEEMLRVGDRERLQ